MFMKIAKMRENRKENKGFSLVELIIVMAIMVALIAVLAPQFIKYVQRARDSVVSDAAENVYEAVKSEWALGHITGEGDFIVYVDSSSHVAVYVGSGITYNNPEDTEATFASFCGIDETKTTTSLLQYKISLDSDGAVSMDDNKTDTSETFYSAEG